MSAAVWSLSGDSLNTAREKHSGCGLQTAALVFGGESGSIIRSTEEYNGTIWATGGDLPENRYYHAGFGTASAAVAAGGYGASRLRSTREYNGATWATGGDLSTEKTASVFAGTLTAGIFAGGHTGSANVLFTEEYNGTAWSSGGDLLKIRQSPGSTGAQTAALTFGNWDASVGAGDALTDSTEAYDGTAWSTEGNMAAGRGLLAGFGTAGTAVACGGNDFGAYTAVTEEYDGAVWATTNSMSVARGFLSAAGTATSGLSVGGDGGSGTIGTTEEYTLVLPGQHRGIAGIDGGVLFDGKTIIGDRANGKLYALDADTYTDNGEEIERIRRSQIINKQQLQVLHNQIEIEFEAGIGLDVGSGVDGEDPQAQLRWSDDGGNNWSEYRSVDIGEYQRYGVRAIWRQLGKSRNRIYELKITDPVKVVLIGADARLTPCRA